MVVTPQVKGMIDSNERRSTGAVMMGSSHLAKLCKGPEAQKGRAGSAPAEGA